MDKIKLTAEDGNDLELYVLEQTVLGGVTYYLAADSEEGDCEAYILKDASGKEDEDAVLSIVTDEAELNALGEVFESLMDDTEIQ